MFFNLRSVSEALKELVAVLRGLLEVYTEARDLEARVDALERSRAMWEAETEAQLVKVDAKYKAVHAAEQRAHAKVRQIEKSQERTEEERELSPEELERLEMAALRGEHGAGSNGEGLQPMLEDLEDRVGQRARAKELKYSR